MRCCPVCGKDFFFDNRDVLRVICRKHNLQSEMCNPGGRELFFRDRGRLQISDMCSMCDERKIREFLGEPPI